MQSNDSSKKHSPLDVDRLIHEPARYAIMAHLYVLERADFLFLTTQIGLTAGNFSTHMGKLEAAGYVEVKKEFLHKKTHTLVSLTLKGRQAFEAYRQHIKQVIDQLPQVGDNAKPAQLTRLDPREDAVG